MAPSPMIKTEVASAAATASKPTTNGKQAARLRFEDVFETLRNEIIADFASKGMPEDAVEWYKRSLNYNTPGGKLNRGLSVVDTVRILKGSDLTEEEYFKSALLGWCVELLQAFFLVSDDMMDNSVTRRGQPCWFRVDGVNMLAINDSFMLESAIYFLLRKHFRQDACYVDLLELFHDVTYLTEMGQLLDLITAPEDQVDLSKFSLERHRLIVVYKTAYYSFYLPVALAMHMSGIPVSQGSFKPYDAAKDILIPLGEYFQVQDDFLDFAGTPEQIGKIGTDILDNKCSWCINTALAVATPEQRALLDENYGRKDSAKERKVKEIYEELDMRGRYAKYEEGAYKKIIGLIESVPETPTADGSPVLKREVFKAFLDKIYKRTK
ncbi:farnesyl-diphosphate synthase [Gloeophyllum trabeum ATCC 11539]|uniref:(2E,6E)-farnesyl diphosphate synthase n=1 Tax=Gloeophyllum trabeum (strain ATCC 11539 / FP-39264 / Madison 617) TaxID=670483 RepID=S7RL38_GLOTA|nr:farnesyl-diphosphate synthase [Gloeophyllum trabeum ATCC 11539]EPQ53384.1 farnesyl-diphosphate synthase [Gloeophyllum trabeum ATCC 11539]